MTSTRCAVSGCSHLAPTDADVALRGDAMQLLIYQANRAIPVPWPTITAVQHGACHTCWDETYRRLEEAMSGPLRGEGICTLPAHLEPEDKEWRTYADLSSADRWRYRFIIAERDGLWFDRGVRYTACGWCGEPIKLDGWGPWAEQPGFPTLDHVNPRSRGGEHLHISNMRLVHWSCNQERSNSPALTRAEWEAS